MNHERDAGKFLAIQLLVQPTLQAIENIPVPPFLVLCICAMLYPQDALRGHVLGVPEVIF